MEVWFDTIPQEEILSLLQSSEREKAVQYLQRGGGVRIINLQFTIDQFELLNGITYDVDLLELSPLGDSTCCHSIVTAGKTSFRV